MYPWGFTEPVVKKEEIQRLKDEDKFKELSHRRIKAAKTNLTSSSLQDPITTKFINYIMEGGRKEQARELLERAFLNIKRTQLERYNLAKTDEEREAIEMNPRILLVDAIENCRPLMKLINVSRGGTNYKVPIPVTEKRSYFMSMRWLIEASNDKGKGIHFSEKMAWEILDAANNIGRVVKRKQDLHKECEANRAYAHYRWLN